ncbi:Transposase [Mycobacterium sp. smrl_JER01]
MIAMCERPQSSPAGSFPEGRRPTVVRADSSADEARTVDTVVVHERGHWAVDIVVVFDDGVVRKRISTHRTRRRADLAADLIKRAAERDLR